jgi:CBS domain containing-hemolysin-like protein
MSVLLFVVFLTIFISAQCSLYEATLYSTRLGTLEAAKAKSKTRQTALKMIQMKKQISEPIATILILNTIANTAGATIAGMYAHKTLGVGLVPIFSIVFTFAILFFAEVIPKTMGAVYWRTLWPVIVWPLTVIKYPLYPLIWVTEKFSNFLTRGRPPARITEEDILGSIRLGAKEGEITEWESLMVHNIIKLENTEVREVMTPRKVMFSLDAEMTIKEALQAAGGRGFTRIPVHGEDKDNILGYVMIHDLGCAGIMSEPDMPLSSIVKPISFAKEKTNCLTLLNRFLKKRSHISIIEDEYGGVAGIITLEDLLETVLGAEIVDETDAVVDLQKLARKRKQRQPAPKKTED